MLRLFFVGDEMWAGREAMVMQFKRLKMRSLQRTFWTFTRERFGAAFVTDRLARFKMLSILDASEGGTGGCCGEHGNQLCEIHATFSFRENFGGEFSIPSLRCW